MSSPRKLAVALTAVALLIGGAACQGSTPDPQGSTVNQSEQMPDLPQDPAAAEALVRKMLMDEAVVLLKASGLRYTDAQFDVPTSFDDGNSQNGELLVDFGTCAPADVQTMTAAFRANGWKEGGKSYGVNGHKGPLFLQWGKGNDGCRLKMTTVNIGQYLPGIKDITSVPELADFKAPALHPKASPA